MSVIESTMTPHLKTQRLRLYAPYHRAFAIDSHVEWLSDPVIMRYSEQRHRRHSQISQWAYIQSFDHVANHIWEISALVDGYDLPVGTITAQRDLNNRTAEVGILLGYPGHGYGSEAWMAVSDWLFTDGVRKIEAGAMSTNIAMLKIFERAGMVNEGVRTDHFLQDGTPVHMTMVGKFNQ
jgi:RimJ/RimL family protein N-acetyltransferase